MGHGYFQLLTCLGVVIMAQAQDCSRPVPGANMDLKGDDILSQTFQNGNKVSLACNIGYASAGGSAVITCIDGSWSPVTLRCEKKSCGHPGEVENGIIHFDNGVDFGDAVGITCNTGFRLVGKDKITCGDQGWMDRLPICEVQTCEPPPVIEGGTFSPIQEIYQFRDVVRYSCQKNFVLDGSQSVSCSEDGTFKPAPPTCSNVECGEPDIPNAYWDGGARPPYKYKSTVTYKCKLGYKMQGGGTLVCDINGQWSPGLPKCEVVTCRSPTNVADGTFSPNKDSYQYNDVVEYSCHKGFTLSGPKSITCSPDGTFKPAPPTCTKVSTPTKAPTTTTTSGTTPSGGGGSNVGAWLGGILGSLVVIFLILIGFLCFKKQRGQKSKRGRVAATLLCVNPSV